MNRDRVLRKNISLGVIYKVLNLAIVFMTIPILLKYLGSENYGVWVTILSVINIFIYLDGGIINGLKTKLSESISSNELNQAKNYISSAYFILVFFSLILFIVGATLIYFIDLKNLLNTTVDQTTIKSVFSIVLFSFLLGYILNLYKPLYYANQNSSIVELSMLIYQLTVLISLVGLLYYEENSLIKVAVVYGLSTIIVGALFTIYFFNKNKLIIPSIDSLRGNTSKLLFNLSFEFFIIQLCMIIIFSTDNIIISNLLGPKEVTKYDIVLKVFQVIITFTVIILDPYWAMYADAFNKKDYSWINSTLKKWNLAFIILTMIVILLTLISKPLIRFWLQEELLIANTLIYLMALFVLVRVYGIIYMYFLNGIGRVKTQMWLYVFGAFINIPLSIYFIKFTQLGSGGVILGTILSVLPMTIILPYQTKKILR